MVDWLQNFAAPPSKRWTGFCQPRTLGYTVGTLDHPSQAGAGKGLAHWGWLAFALFGIQPPPEEAKLSLLDTGDTWPGEPRGSLLASPICM